MKAINYEVKNGKVRVPVKDYEALLERMEELEDIAAYKDAMGRDEESYPAEIIKRIVVGGENPVRVYREYRGLSQEGLAKAIGKTKTTISEIETGRKQGSIDTLKAIAEALIVDLDQIV